MTGSFWLQNVIFTALKNGFVIGLLATTALVTKVREKRKTLWILSAAFVPFLAVLAFRNTHFREIKVTVLTVVVVAEIIDEVLILKC